METRAGFTESNLYRDLELAYQVENCPAEGGPWSFRRKRLSETAFSSSRWGILDSILGYTRK